NKLLAMSQNNVTMADGIYVDNIFLGAVEDGNEFLLYIDGILQEYRTGIEHEKVMFTNKVVVQEGVYPVSVMCPVHAIKNNLNAEDDTLNLGIQVTRRETYTEEVPFEIDYKDDTRYPKTYEEIISNGVPGQQEVLADVVYVDGEKVGETRLETTVTKEPVRARKMRGTLSPTQFLPAGSDISANFIWPVAGGHLSCGLHDYRGHTGMDIGANSGIGIYASRSGTVTLAYSYSRGDYGKHIYIDHGNGMTTRYAHCSEVMVKAGQYVRQGQLIAKVGQTGRAYGAHLHFEIRINGKVMNPADYIGEVYPG
ncbi:MAG: peptidoglycan DD-metalloendopeptidase family protein, partial [Angelakisella sp.]